MNRQLSLPIDGGLVVGFKTPPAGEAVPFAVAAADREPILQGTLEIMAWTDVDDARLARRIVSTPEALVVILRARNTLLRDARDRGVLHAACPSCDAQATWSMPAYSMRLGAEPPAWLHRGYFLEPLQMGLGLRRATRPKGRSGPLQIALPSGETRRLYPPPMDGSDKALPDWTAFRAKGRYAWESLGIRALAAGAIALGEPFEATCERPVGDLFALDALQWLATCVPIHEAFACPSCAKKFLPVHP